jgi:hypothetical protein
MATSGVKMRGANKASGSLFSYVDLEARIPARHPLRKIRQVINEALASHDAAFEALYADCGRHSIAPERLIRESLIQILFSVRSERQLMEQSTICCSAGSSASASTIPSGWRPSLPRTATGC